MPSGPINNQTWLWRQARAETSERAGASRDLVLRPLMSLEGPFNFYLLCCPSTLTTNKCPVAEPSFGSWTCYCHYPKKRQAADGLFSPCWVWRVGPSRSGEETQPAMKHYPNNLCYWPHSHALTVSILFAFSLFLSNRRRHTFPQNFWGCSVTSWSACCEIHSVLVEKVDHVKRWMKLSIWPVSIAIWKEPYCLFVCFSVIKVLLHVLTFVTGWDAFWSSVVS